MLSIKSTMSKKKTMKIIIITLAVLATTNFAATVAYWRFEDGANGVESSIYLDLSGNNSVMTSNGSSGTNAVPFTIIPQTVQTNTLAAEYEATGAHAGDYLTTDGIRYIDTFNFDGTGWTIEAVVKFHSYTNWGVHARPGIVCKEGNNLTYPFFNLQLDENGKIRVVTSRTSPSERRIYGTTTLETGKWYAIAVTYDRLAEGTDREAELYLKGEGDSVYNREGGTSGPWSGIELNGDTPWTIGRGFRDNGGKGYVDGIIDEVRISDSLLSTADFLGTPAATNIPSSENAINNPFTYYNWMHDGDTMKYNGEYYFSCNIMRGDSIVSRNLRNWGWRTHVFSWSNSWFTPIDPSDPDRNIAAGHFRYYNGTFHYYVQLGVDTPDHGNILHATADNPLGPYTEVDYSAPFSQYIDSDSFRDDNGSFYFYSTLVNDGKEKVYYRTMSDLWTLTSGYNELISPSGWNGANIDEASKVIKRRGRYYMLYNAYMGSVSSSPWTYAIGCTEANSPTAFNNTGKYSQPIVKTTSLRNGSNEISRIGQSWVVDGPNGFEKWLGYFAVYYDMTSGSHDEIFWGQYIDRMYFNGPTLYIDGPTHRDSTGYHPKPAMPEYLGLFNKMSGTLSDAWTLGSGSWAISNNELRQNTATGFNNVILNSKSSEYFLFEANIKLLDPASQKAGVTIVKDANNWLRVGLDKPAGKWYYQKYEAGSSSSASYNLEAGFDFQAYHCIRLLKNGNTVDVKIDQIPAPPSSSVSMNFNGPAKPELFTDGAKAAFDGVIYTIGWDEWDSNIKFGWGNSKSGVPQTGTWNYNSDGIHQSNTNGGFYTFKGDLMNEYEVDVHVSVIDSNSNADRRLGIFAVAVDANNYLTAQINPQNNQLVVGGLHGGAAIPEQAVAISYNPTPGYWNIRAAKLNDKVIIFVNGKEELTIEKSFAAAQVGLITGNQNARFDDILVYETKDGSSSTSWKSIDIGNVNYKGQTEFSEDYITISASGDDFWGTADEGNFVYQEISSDKEIIAKVQTLNPSRLWAKACVMIRENLSSNSPMAYQGITRIRSTMSDNTNQAAFVRRLTTGAATSSSVLYDTNMLPSYVKLSRLGDTFSGYWSRDGVSWQLIGSQTITMDQNCYIGLAVTANDNSRYGDAIFSDVTIQDTSVDAAAYWRFEEGVNGVAHNADNDGWYLDSSGKNSPMPTLNSSSRPVATDVVPFAIVPQTMETNTLALQFNGVDDFLSSTGSEWIDTHNFVSGWTIEAMVKFDSLGSGTIRPSIICKEGDLGTERYPYFNLQLDPITKNIWVVTARDNGDSRIIKGTSTTIETGKWYCIAVTYDRNATGSDREVELFIKEETDALYVLEAGSGGPWSGIDLNGDNPWTIGSGYRNGARSGYVDGIVDEVRITDTILPPMSFLGVGIPEPFLFINCYLLFIIYYFRKII